MKRRRWLVALLICSLAILTGGPFLFLNRLGADPTGKAEVEKVPEYPSAAPETASILFAGDTHFQWAVGGSDSAIEALVRPIAPTFQSADFRVLNLETAISQGETPSANRSNIFNARPGVLVGLRPLKLGLAILANNHIMDQGTEGLKQTLSSVAGEGLLSAGAGLNAADASKPVLFNVGQIRFALIAASAIGDDKMWATAKQAGAARATQELVSQVINVRRQVDFVIVSIHWGVEYNPYPEPEQVQLARLLAAAGAAAIIGHHPHVPQGIEVVRGSIICYSLGNFLFGSANPYQRPNILLKITFSKKDPGITAIQMIPITGVYRTQGHTVRPLSAAELTDFWPEYYTQSVKTNPAMRNRFSLLPDGSGLIKP